MGVASSYEICPICGEYEMHLSVDTRSGESWGVCHNCGAYHEDGIVTPKKDNTIEIRDDCIAIVNSVGEDTAVWSKDEWIEDPDIVFSIVNAVKEAYDDEDDDLE